MVFFSSDQSGFLRLHSTLTCLLKMSDDWYNGLDLGKLVGLVFIDLKKAFEIKFDNYVKEALIPFFGSIDNRYKTLKRYYHI